MRKNALFIGLFLILVLSSKAQKSSLLWQISGKNLTDTSYLYGTIHLICPDEINIHKEVEVAFSTSQQLYLELDLDDESEKIALREATENSTHLRKALSKRNYEKVEQFFSNEIGLSIEPLAMIKPFYLLSYLYKPIIGCPNPTSIEAVLMQQAHQNNMDIKGLESVARQTKIFKHVSTKKQAKILLKQVKKEKHTLQNYANLLTIYKQEDIQHLRKITSKDPTKHLNKLLIKQRNKEWVMTIPTIAQSKSTFFAFGAAHLGGRNGVIRLLQKQGYTLTPIFTETMPN